MNLLFLLCHIFLFIGASADKRGHLVPCKEDNQCRTPMKCLQNRCNFAKSTCNWANRCAFTGNEYTGSECSVGTDCGPDKMCIDGSCWAIFRRNATFFGSLKNRPIALNGISCGQEFCGRGFICRDSKCVFHESGSRDFLNLSCKKKSDCGDIRRFNCVDGQCVVMHGTGGTCQSDGYCKNGFKCSDNKKCVKLN